MNISKSKDEGGARNVSDDIKCAEIFWLYVGAKISAFEPICVMSGICVLYGGVKRNLTKEGAWNTHHAIFYKWNRSLICAEWDVDCRETEALFIEGA